MSPLTSMYTQSLFAICRILYWSIISSRMLEMWSRMYLYSFMGVPREKLLRSKHIYSAWSVEMTLFHRIFYVVRSDV
jgi:hypothetical protein